MISKKWGMAVLCAVASGSLYVLSPELGTTIQRENEPHIVTEKQQTIHQSVTPTSLSERAATLSDILSNEEATKVIEDPPQDTQRLSHYLDHLVQTGEISKHDRKLRERLLEGVTDLLDFYESVSHRNLETLLKALEGHELKPIFISEIIEYSKKTPVYHMAVIAYEIESALESPYAERLKQHVIDDINEDLEKGKKLRAAMWSKWLYSNEYVHDINQKVRKKHYNADEISTAVTRLSADMAESNPSLLRRLLEKTKEYYQDKRTEPFIFDVDLHFNYLNKLKEYLALSKANGNVEDVKKYEGFIKEREESYRKWRNGGWQREKDRLYDEAIREVDGIIQTLQ